MKWYELKLYNGPVCMITRRFRTGQEAIDAYGWLIQNTKWVKCYTFDLLEVDTDGETFFDTLEYIKELYTPEV